MPSPRQQVAAVLLLGFARACEATPAAACSFCARGTHGETMTFDLHDLPSSTFSLGSVWPNGTEKRSESYGVTSPCAGTDSARCGPSNSPMTQGCKSLGVLASDGPNSTIVTLTSDGFSITVRGGFDYPAMPRGRNAVFDFICDRSAPSHAGPEPGVLEQPGGFYHVRWKTAAACNASIGKGVCSPPPPAPPPVPPPAPCTPGAEVCLPSWNPTWHMRNSTVLYTCNNSGMHDVAHANKFGIVVYDWSNAKAIWANTHPMSSEELITKQAEMVYADDPGLPGYAPRVWAYRNTIKALNWYTSVRKKLDDPRYAFLAPACSSAVCPVAPALTTVSCIDVLESSVTTRYSSWFIKFKDFNNSAYPGGTTSATKAANGSYHVPTCDWFGDAKSGPPKCSGFYHDQEQTPEHASPGGGSYPAYHVDGQCIEQCDCGKVNPCAEYIFDHRGGNVDGQTFRDWCESKTHDASESSKATHTMWINEYMISNETLLHKDPKTGKQQVIGLGWLDDSMQLSGPTEEDKHYIADTCGSNTSTECVKEMQSQVDAYQASKLALIKKVIPMGGFWWQLMGHNDPVTTNAGCDPEDPKHCKAPVSAATCKAMLRRQCQAKPSSWNKMQLYSIQKNGNNFAGVTPRMFTDYTAEFLLTRGPYAILGYSWCGCTNGNESRPRAKEWDEDFGQPVGSKPCHETHDGIFEREWTKAKVQWDCNVGHGSITRK